MQMDVFSSHFKALYEYISYLLRTGSKKSRLKRLDQSYLSTLHGKIQEKVSLRTQFRLNDRCERRIAGKS